MSSFNKGFEALKSKGRTEASRFGLKGAAVEHFALGYSVGIGAAPANLAAEDPADGEASTAAASGFETVEAMYARRAKEVRS